MDARSRAEADGSLSDCHGARGPPNMGTGELRGVRVCDGDARLHLSHPDPASPGQLASVARAIADGEGIIGDVVTVSLGREHSFRDITIEVGDIGQAERHCAAD